MLKFVVLFCSNSSSTVGVTISKYLLSTFCTVMRSISFEDTAVFGLVAIVKRHGMSFIMEANFASSFMAKSCRTSENHMVLCPTSALKVLDIVTNLQSVSSALRRGLGWVDLDFGVPLSAHLHCLSWAARQHNMVELEYPSHVSTQSMSQNRWHTLYMCYLQLAKDYCTLEKRCPHQDCETGLARLQILAHFLCKWDCISWSVLLCQRNSYHILPAYRGCQQQPHDCGLWCDQKEVENVTGWLLIPVFFSLWSCSPLLIAQFDCSVWKSFSRYPISGVACEKASHTIN